MDFGVATFPTDLSLGPDELAKMVEDRGFESIFFPEHTHIPASRETPYPPGGDLPDEYRRIVDPFVALTAAAMAAPTLKARDRPRPGDRARPDRDRQGGRIDSTCFRAAA